MLSRRKIGGQCWDRAGKAAKKVDCSHYCGFQELRAVVDVGSGNAKLTKLGRG